MRATISMVRASLSSSATTSGRRWADRCIRTKPSYLRTTKAIGRTLEHPWLRLFPDNASRAKAVASVRPFAQPLACRQWPRSADQRSRQRHCGVHRHGASTHPRRLRTTRFDENIGAKDTLNAIYTVDDSTASTPSSNPYSYVNERLREQVLSAQEQHIFARIVNIARFGYSRSNFYFYGYVPAQQQALAPSVRTGVPTYAVVIAGSTASNGASSITAAGANVGLTTRSLAICLPSTTTPTTPSASTPFRAVSGSSACSPNDNLAQDQYGQASFASLSTFLAEILRPSPMLPQQQELAWRSLFVDAFLEDTYRISSRLEARFGFRSESSTGGVKRRGARAFTLHQRHHQHHTFRAAERSHRQSRFVPA